MPVAPPPSTDSPGVSSGRPKLSSFFNRLMTTGNENGSSAHFSHPLSLTKADLSLQEHLKKLDLRLVRRCLEFYDFSVYRFIILPVTTLLPSNQRRDPINHHSMKDPLSGSIETFGNGSQFMDHYMVYPSVLTPDSLFSPAKKNDSENLTIESIHAADESRKQMEFDYLFDGNHSEAFTHTLSTKHRELFKLINLLNIDTPFDYQMRLFKEEGIVNRLAIYGKSKKAMALANQKNALPSSFIGNSSSQSFSVSSSINRTGSSTSLASAKSNSSLNLIVGVQKTTDSKAVSSPTTTGATNGQLTPEQPGSLFTAEYYDEYHTQVQQLEKQRNTDDFDDGLDINSIEEVQRYLYELRKQVFVNSLVKNLFGKKKVEGDKVPTQQIKENKKGSSANNVELIFPSLSFCNTSHNEEQSMIAKLLKTVPNLVSLSRFPTPGIAEQMLSNENVFKSVQYFNQCSIDYKLISSQLANRSFDGQLPWKKLDYFDHFSNETCSLLAEKCRNVTQLAVGGSVFLDPKLQAKDIVISQIPPSRILSESGLMDLAQHCKQLTSICIKMGKWEPKGTNALLENNSLPLLTRLDVPGSNLDESTFAAIAKNTTLKHLVLSNCAVCNDQTLKSLYGHPTINILELKNCPGIENGLLGLVEASISGRGSLKHLDLLNLHNINDGFLEVLAKNTTIHTLKINHCRVLTSQNLSVMAKSATNTALTNLQIRGTTDSISLACIGQGILASQLQVLDLSMTSFPYTQVLKSEGPITAFQPVYYPVVPVVCEDYKTVISACKQLRVLILDCNHNVDDSVVSLLSEQTHPFLETLSLEKTSVTLKGITHIFTHYSSSASNLSKINLRVRTFGEMNMLDQMHSVPKLREVHLGLVRAHSVAMHYVKKLTHCPALETVYVEFDSLEAKHKLVESKKIKNIFFEL